MCSFPGTEAQPAAPANAFGSQQAKSNPAQLSLLQFSPALPVPCTRMCVYSCHSTWAPETGGSGPGSRTSSCSGVFFLCASFMLGPKIQARVSVWQVLRGYWEERQRGTHLPSAWVEPGRRNHSSLGQLHAWHGVALKTEMEFDWHPAHAALDPR